MIMYEVMEGMNSVAAREITRETEHYVWPKDNPGRKIKEGVFFDTFGQAKHALMLRYKKKINHHLSIVSYYEKRLMEAEEIMEEE